MGLGWLGLILDLGGSTISGAGLVPKKKLCSESEPVPRDSKKNKTYGLFKLR